MQLFCDGMDAIRFARLVHKKLDAERFLCIFSHAGKDDIRRGKRDKLFILRLRCLCHAAAFGKDTRGEFSLLCNDRKGLIEIRLVCVLVELPCHIAVALPFRRIAYIVDIGKRALAVAPRQNRNAFGIPADGVLQARPYRRGRDSLRAGRRMEEQAHLLLHAILVVLRHRREEIHIPSLVSSLKFHQQTMIFDAQRVLVDHV
ncbi:hypothetical protein [uncultured Mitsuokella sp.]|uniref:hypothetical protein n=1 Tax=uncultured Mitsuokella sp. TaxID=453120 RepID=UPI00344DE863